MYNYTVQYTLLLHLLIKINKYYNNNYTCE